MNGLSSSFDENVHCLTCWVIFQTKTKNFLNGVLFYLIVLQGLIFTKKAPSQCSKELSFIKKKS